MSSSVEHQAGQSGATWREGDRFATYLPGGIEVVPWLCLAAFGAALICAVFMVHTAEEQSGLVRPWGDAAIGGCIVGALLVVLASSAAASRIRSHTTRQRLLRTGVRAVARITDVDRLGVWRGGRPSPFQVSALELHYQFTSPSGQSKGLDEVPRRVLDALDRIPGPGDPLEVAYSPEDPERSVICALLGGNLP